MTGHETPTFPHTVTSGGPQALHPEARQPTIVDVAPGGSFDLRIGAVAKWIDGRPFEMLAYNGSIPGPTIRVRQGSHIDVHVTNETVMDTTVHWHGLRLENRFDGVPHETQEPIPPGGTYTHRLVFPDPGIYWYHPHIREDIAQELGLYGNVVVEPADGSYWPAVDREILLTLDDILIENDAIAPFGLHANFVAMGRFGNTLLVGGETQQTFAVETGEVVRLLLTNTANTRVFRIAMRGAPVKLVGGDSGRYEREEFVDDVVIAPSERAVIDVSFERAGQFQLEHRTPGRTYLLATFDVSGPTADREALRSFGELRTNAEMLTERLRIAPYLDAPPDRTLALVAELDFSEPVGDGPILYTCPMHPQVASEEPGTCPLCAMKLMPRSAEQAASASDAAAGHDHGEALEDGIEWEDLMFEVNRGTDTTNTRWKLIDRDTGAENGAIDWSFDVGQQVKIRLVNEMASDHPMHHPFHIHGERFLVLSRDGVAEPNLVWKDTVLIRTGETIDILVDAANPGLWMAHCHIAEHLETGMMFSFRVGRPDS